MSFPFAVFDVDGTLVDSRTIITVCMDHAFEQVGLEAPGYERTRRIIGLSLPIGLDVLAPDADDALRAQLLTAYRDVFFKLRQDPALASPLYEGVAEMLESLAASGWVLGIATGKSRRGLDALIDQFGWRTLFTTHWCADDGPSKPHPHMVIENMRAVGATPLQTVVIGDTDHDIAMAKAAGAQAIGVSWGFGKHAEMLEAGATQVLETMPELAATLKEFHLALPKS